MSKAVTNLGTIHIEILEALRSSPAGLDVYELRARLTEGGIQQHLDRRIRDLRDRYSIPRRKVGGRWVYIYEGELRTPAPDTGRISRTLRAEVLHRAQGRCQMCGRSVSEDDIKLEIDHKIPRSWGGETASENLWALCQSCNGGKRNYFANFDDEMMRRILSKRSVYERLSETLRLHLGRPTPSWLLEFVANSTDFQEDWHKRLRELRYPPIGLVIRATRRKNPSGKWESAYQLDVFKDLPENHKQLIKDHERRTRVGD